MPSSMRSRRDGELSNHHVADCRAAALEAKGWKPAEQAQA